AICLSFFFQAEDGIRDFHVTGVQTCALPIFDRGVLLLALRRRGVGRTVRDDLLPPVARLAEHDHRRVRSQYSQGPAPRRGRYPRRRRPSPGGGRPTGRGSTAPAGLRAR